MERTLATINPEGKFVLPIEVHSALGIPADANVDVVVGDQGIQLLIEERQTTSSNEVKKLISEIQSMFDTQPTAVSEDKHLRMRSEEDEIRSLAGSLASQPDMVKELQNERRQDKW